MSFIDTPQGPMPMGLQDRVPTKSEQLRVLALQLSLQAAASNPQTVWERGEDRIIDADYLIDEARKIRKYIDTGN